MHKLVLKFGANVYGRNNHCGQLKKVVVEPNFWQLTDLIIEDGLIFKRAVVLPVYQVENTLGQTVNLKVSSKELTDFQEYGETTIEKGVPNWPATKTVGEMETMSLGTTHIPNLNVTREKTRLGVRSDAMILDDTTRVVCLDGRVGYLSHVVVDAQDHLITDLVFKQGTMFPKHYIVSTYYVDSLSENQAQIAKTRAEAEQLPEYTFLHYR